MSVSRVNRLHLLIAVSVISLPACLGSQTAAFAQARNELDALAYHAPEAAAPQPPAQPPIAQRGLFTSPNGLFGHSNRETSSAASGNASSPGGLFAAMSTLGSGFSMGRRTYAAPQQAYAQMPAQPQPSSQPQVYAQAATPAAAAPAPAKDLDTQASGKPADAPRAEVQQEPPRPVARRGLFTSESFRSQRRGYVPAPVRYAPPPPPVITYDPNYRLDAGDKLRVVVYGQEGLTNSYAISASGTITMPLIGNVPARGSTPAALAASITARLRDGFIREPSVAVEIEAYRPFFILGEVAAPGQYPYVPHMSVESAVAIAGGFSPRAKRDIVTLTQATPEGLFRALVPVNTPLKPGDTILVGERWF